MYENETFELENVWHMLKNNELMKKIDFIEEASGLVFKEQRGRSQSRGSKKGIKLLVETMIATTANSQGT